MILAGGWGKKLALTGFIYQPPHQHAYPRSPMTHDDNTRLLRRAVHTPSTSSSAPAFEASFTAAPTPHLLLPTSTTPTTTSTPALSGSSISLSTPPSSDAEDSSPDSDPKERDSPSTSSALNLALVATQTLTLGRKTGASSRALSLTPYDSYFSHKARATSGHLSRKREVNDHGARSSLASPSRGSGGAIEIPDSFRAGGRDFDVDDIIMPLDRDGRADPGTPILF